MFGTSCYQEVEFGRADPGAAPRKERFLARIKDACIKSEAGNSESQGGTCSKLHRACGGGAHATPVNRGIGLLVCCGARPNRYVHFEVTTLERSSIVPTPNRARGVKGNTESAIIARALEDKG
jgi:hypothetical protein